MDVLQLEARGFQRGLYRPRKGPVYGVVLHTTGYGPWKRWAAGGFESPFEAAIHIYTKLTDNSGHVLVCGQTGKVAQLAPFEVAARHVGGRGGYRYKWPAWGSLNPNVGWWSRRWPELRSPRDLLGGQAWSPRPNQTSVGVEVSPPLAGPRAPWTDACWTTLSGLARRLSRQLQIPKSPYYFVGHSDVHPLSRSARRAPWDPSPLQFEPVRDIARLFPDIWRPDV